MSGMMNPQMGQMVLNPAGQMVPAGQPAWAPIPGQSPMPTVMYPTNQGGQAFVPQVQPGQGRMTLGGDEILDGQGIPAELRGRKASEVFRIYNALADDFITRQRRGQQQPQGQQQPGQQQPQVQGQQPAPQNQPNQYWLQNPNQQPNNQGAPAADPESMRLEGIVRRVVGEAVAPFAQQNLAGSIRGAVDYARQNVPDFGQLEADIMETVRGASDEALARPDFWVNAADLARGKRYRQNAGNGIPQANMPGGNGGAASLFAPRGMPAQGYPQPNMPTNMNPAMMQPGQNPASMMATPRPQTQQFFTESPTAPSVYQNTHSGVLTEVERRVAASAGMTEENYLAWRNIQDSGQGRQRFPGRNF